MSLEAKELLEKEQLVLLGVKLKRRDIEKGIFFKEMWRWKKFKQDIKVSIQHTHAHTHVHTRLVGCTARIPCAYSRLIRTSDQLSINQSITPTGSGTVKICHFLWKLLRKAEEWPLSVTTHLSHAPYLHVKKATQYSSVCFWKNNFFLGLTYFICYLFS